MTKKYDFLDLPLEQFNEYIDREYAECIKNDENKTAKRERQSKKRNVRKASNCTHENGIFG